MSPSDKLRQDLKKVIERRQLSYRQISSKVNINHVTIFRFLKGPHVVISYDNAVKLLHFLAAEP